MRAFARLRRDLTHDTRPSRSDLHEIRATRLHTSNGPLYAPSRFPIRRILHDARPLPRKSECIRHGVRAPIFRSCSKSDPVQPRAVTVRPGIAPGPSATLPGSRDRERGAKPTGLLDVDLTAGRFDLLLNLVGLVLRNAFLDRLGRALDELLGLLETEAGDPADLLDDLDLLVAKRGQNDVELRLLLGGGIAAAGRRRQLRLRPEPPPRRPTSLREASRAQPLP